MKVYISSYSYLQQDWKDGDTIIGVFLSKELAEKGTIDYINKIYKDVKSNKKVEFFKEHFHQRIIECELNEIK
jgi:phosphomannomutase